MQQYIFTFLKGIAMGIANVIPGVSGGTVALITGIFDKLVSAIKSFNLSALKLLFKGDFKGFAATIQLDFLLALFAGVFVSILTVAKVFKYLFSHYPTFLWAFFFGLVLASVFYVAKTLKRKNALAFLYMFIGASIALCLTLLTPASENASMVYLFVCGIVAACSMILPGLSGSFVLILMGNYQLVMIQAVSDANISILLPVVLGAGFGILAFSHLLSWVFQHFRDQTIALLTGLIVGSLAILWPWKRAIYLTDSLGEPILKKGEPILKTYEWIQPDSWVSTESLGAMLFCLLGIALIVVMEKIASSQSIKK